MPVSNPSPKYVKPVSLVNVARSKGIITDKFTSHNYEWAYEEYFSKLDVFNRPVRMLEIGLGCGQGYGPGGSVRLWYAYFEAIGIPLELHIFEYEQSCAEEWRRQQNFTNLRMYYGDQGNIGDLKKAVNASGGNFDIIVDDGSHRWSHQILTLRTLFRIALRPGGYYFIEDTITSVLRLNYADQQQKTTEFLAQVTDDLAMSFDGVLIVTGHSKNTVYKDLCDLVFRVDAMPGLYVLSKISDEQKSLIEKKNFRKFSRA